MEIERQRDSETETDSETGRERARERAREKRERRESPVTRGSVMSVMPHIQFPAVTTRRMVTPH